MARTFDEFTESAKQVLVLAQREAQRLEHARVGTGHLILGLTNESDDLAARLLRDSGAQLPALRTALIDRLGLGSTTAGAIHGLTTRAKAVMSMAVEESERRKDRFIGTEHLLFGVLREGQGAGIDILATVGIDVARFRKRLSQELNNRSGLSQSEPDPL
jgi:ATP-dependent Clp protease ATP-binding subunit ClpC